MAGGAENYVAPHMDFPGAASLAHLVPEDECAYELLVAAWAAPPTTDSPRLDGRGDRAFRDREDGPGSAHSGADLEDDLSDH